MSVHQKVPTTRAWRASRVAGCALALLFVGRPLHAQSVDTRWRLSGDAGGMLGGTWLSGGEAPVVSGGAGAELSLRATRGLSRRVSGGGALRVASQPLQFREHNEHWSGPTLSTGAFVGVLSTRVAQTETWQSALELGAGGAWLAGARSVFPFSTASRVAPVLEAGMAFHHEPRLSSTGRPTKSLLGQTGVFARYSMLRIDPGAVPAGNPGAQGATGWAGRVALGLRVDR